MPIITVAEASRQALESLLKDERVFVIGEGVPDPKGCFFTTSGLKEKFPNRIFDMPISEAGVTGICLGASLLGMRPVMIHMRADFTLYAADQIVNNCAKWNSMFGGAKNAGFVIKAFTGRGWGAGNQHSQNLEALFAHVPGLKVVCPSNPSNAWGLMLSASMSGEMVLILEHRWIHPMKAELSLPETPTEIGRARVARAGAHITLVSWSYMVTECLNAAEFLEAEGISCEVLDMQTIKPMDMAAIKSSLKRTKNLMVVNEAWGFCGVAAEILASVAEDGDVDLKSPSRRLTNPDFPCPSTPALSKFYYKGVKDIVKGVADQLNRSINPMPAIEYQESRIHDIPDPQYVGPF